MLTLRDDTLDMGGIVGSLHACCRRTWEDASSELAEGTRSTLDGTELNRRLNSEGST